MPFVVEWLYGIAGPNRIQFATSRDGLVVIAKVWLTRIIAESSTERTIRQWRRGTPRRSLIGRIRMHRFGQITGCRCILIVPGDVDTAVALIHRDERRELRAIISRIAIEKNRRANLTGTCERA